MPPAPFPIDPADPTIDRLVAASLAVRLAAHAPYSRFQVGAALLCDDSEVFTGCNVENVSFSLTLCAERVAAAAAVTAQHRIWRAIAIASPGGVTPCGACRQFLAEFGQDLLVLSVDAQTGERQNYLLSELLPHAFDRTALDPLTHSVYKSRPV
jgi:cytidine deaminase